MTAPPTAAAPARSTTPLAAAAVSFPVRIRRPGKQGFVAGETTSLSQTDLLVRPEEPIPVNADVDLYIVVGHELPPCRMKVVAREGDQVRLTYIAQPGPVTRLLERLLQDSSAFGDYVLEALIGTGAMAEVYRALVKNGPHRGSVVALKRLSPKVAVDSTLHELFLNEADLTRMLDHPGIVKVIQAGAVGDTYFIAMEHLEGGSINDLLRACKEANLKLPVDFCCYVAGLVANALEYTHSYRGRDGSRAGIVHCDVTPSNILIAASGAVKLTDFGVAHVGALAADEGVIVGKALYQPPEQIRGDKVSPDSDVFALAAVLYEMLTNVPAFDAEDVEGVHRRILRYQVRPPHELRPEIPLGLSKLIMLALSPDRASDRLGFFVRLWRRTFGRRIPKRTATAADFGMRVRVFSEPLYSAPEVVQVVVNKLREARRFRPLFAPLQGPPKKA